VRIKVLITVKKEPVFSSETSVST